MRPDLRHVKDIETICLRILRLHDLYIYSPRWILLSLNCLKQVLLMVVWILACEFSSSSVGVILDSLVRFEVNFHVVE